MQYVICVCAVVVIIVLFMSMQNKVNTTEYDLKANVTDIRINNSKMLLGVSNDVTEFNFGSIPVNISTQKFLDLKNNEPIVSLIEIQINGTISDYVELTEDSFVLESGAMKQVGLTFHATKKGIYEGKIYIDVVTPTHQSLAFISLWKLR